MNKRDDLFESDYIEDKQLKPNKFDKLFEKNKSYSEKRVTPAFQNKDKPKNSNLTLTCPILSSVHVLNTLPTD